MVKLNYQQEQFARAVFKGVGLGSAYKAAGYKAKSRNSQDANASHLIRNPKIVERMEEMAREARVSEAVTVHSVTDMLSNVYQDARKYKQIGAAATAAMGIAKLHGLLVDRIEDVTRRPTRDPDAPLEIEVEHWLTEHNLLGNANGHASTQQQGLNGSADTSARGSASPGMDADYQKDDAITDVPGSDDPASGD